MNWLLIIMSGILACLITLVILIGHCQIHISRIAIALTQIALKTKETEYGHQKITKKL